jgi:predicted nucleotidyltransferase
MTIPKDLKQFLAVIKTELPRVLGGNCFGIYVYGSLSYGNFGENRSDVDVAVVIKKKLNKVEITKIDNWFKQNKLKASRWHKRAEIDFICLGDLKKIKANTIKTVRLAGGKLREKSKMEGVGLDLINLREQGIVMFGPQPKKIFPKVPKKFLKKALKEKYFHLKRHAFKWEKIDLWNQQFLVSQFCRVLYAIKNNYRAISKKAATQWAVKNVPAKFVSMVKITLKRIDNFYGPREKIISDSLFDFIDYIGSKLR